LAVLHSLAPFFDKGDERLPLRQVELGLGSLTRFVGFKGRFRVVFKDENIGCAARFLLLDGGDQFELGPGTPLPPLGTLVFNAQWTAQSFPQDADDQVEVRGKRNVLLVITGRLHRFVLPEVRLNLDAVLKLHGDSADHLLGQMPFSAYVTGRRNKDLVSRHETAI
jgi:hypothetical protein